MNIGDTITIPTGKEKELAHVGIPMVINTITGESISLKLPDGSIYNGYTKADLTLPAANQPPFKAPEVLEVVVNPTEKVKEGPTAFSFSKPQEAQKEITNPTKIDTQSTTKHPTLEEAREQIKREETPKPNSEYSDYYDNAEMLIDGWTVGLASICNFFADDTSIKAYEYPVETANKLKRQLTKILIKHNKMLPIEALFGGTIVGATFPIIVKATTRRKVIKELEASKTPAEKLADKKEKTKRKPGGQPK